MSSKKTLVCPSCSRKFATRAALTQHRRAAHGTGVPAVKPAATVRRARRSPGVINPGGNSALRVTTSSGSDLLRTVDIPAKLGHGRVLAVLKLGPHSFLGTRFHVESQIWARWRPVSLKLRVQCSGASTTFGSISVGWSPELDEWIGTSDLNLARIMSLRPSSSVKLNSSATLSIPSETTRKWYFTNSASGAPEDSIHGVVPIVTSAATGGYDGVVTCHVILDWNVQFEGIESTARGVQPEIISPDAGNVDLFTTSDGSLSGEYLTFKTHAGGSATPFSAARPGAIYTTYSDTRVPYYDTTGAEKHALYFSLWQSKGPYLLLFSTRSSAEEYVKGGDERQALRYKAAGKYTTPSTPRFIETSLNSAASPELSMLRGEVDSLRQAFELLAAGPLRALVSDTAVYSASKNLLRDLRERPKGTTLDPVKVLVEDPILTDGEEDFHVVVGATAHQSTE